MAVSRQVNTKENNRHARYLNPGDAVMKEDTGRQNAEDRRQVAEDTGSGSAYSLN
jgi:hypothetical protein